MRFFKLISILILISNTPAPAYNKADSLEALLPLTSGTEKIEILNGLSKAYWGISNDRAFDYANLALGLSQEIAYRDGEATALKNIGVCHSNLSENDKALEYYHKALQIYRETGNKIGIANSLNNIGIIYIEMDEYDKALEYYIQSAEIYETAGDSSGIAASLLNMGLIYDYLKVNAKALEYYEESYALFELIGEKSGSAMCLNNIGNIFSDQGDKDKALDYYRRCLKINEDTGDLYAIGDALLNIGYAYDELGQYERSLEYYEKSIRIDEEAGDRYGMAINLNNMGDLYRKLARYDDSLDHLTRSLQIARDINSLDMMKENYDCLAKLYADKGNHQSALEYYKLFEAMKDSIFSEDSSNRIAEMQTRYDTEKKVKENELLRKEKEIQQAAISRQKAVTTSIGIGLCLVLVLALVMIRAYSNKKKANLVLDRQKRQIEEQANDLRQANDKLLELDRFKQAMAGMIVHDLKNPLGAIINYSDNSEDLTQKIIHQSGRQMLNLVMNILDVQKFEDAQMRLATEDISLNQIIRSALGQVDFLCREKNIDMENKCPPEITVNADPGIIERVFINLMTNAIKYSPLNSRIVIEASDNSDDNIRVSVIDYGDGIPKNMLDRVFDKFQQVEPRKSNRVRSTGLGLTFCKMAVESHGGIIGAESEIGQGTTFWFTLRKSTTAAAPADMLEQSVAADWVLSDPDKLYLAPYVGQMKRLEIFEISDLRNVLNKIETDGNEALKVWKEQIRRAVYTSNDEKFRELIKM